MSSSDAAVEDMDVGDTSRAEMATAVGEGNIPGVEPKVGTKAGEEDVRQASLELEGQAVGDGEAAAPTAAAAAAGAREEGNGEATTPPERKARLLITKMEMENFKSYGGLREIGPFHKCFSSIVGPNGSGKSNVIDAMLFVFGKRAKKLRLNKVSDLIHSSDTYGKLDFARVSVHFVDILDVDGSEDDYEEVPGTRLVVTRTAYSNNQSKYQVDGKNTTFAEVGALLRKRGVDLDNNRFLILQGEVEQIAMMKPKALTPHEEGLLEYLEDIIGSDRFVEAAEEAAKMVEVLKDKRAEKLNRVTAAEKEKNSLEGARAEADQFLRLEATIRKKQSVLYQCHVANASANVEKVMAKEVEKKERLEHEKTKLAATQKEVKDAKKKHAAIAAEHEALKAEMTRAQEEFHEYERKDVKHTASIKHLKEQARKLETAAKKDEKRAKDSLARAAELEGSLEGLKRGVSQAEARKESEDAALEEVNQSLKGKTAELRGELEGEQERARPVREEADALRNKVETCKCEMRLVRESAEDAKGRLAKAEKALAALRKKAVDDKAELAAAGKERRSMEAQITEAEGEVVDAQKKLAAATEAMGKALSEAEEAKASRESAAGKSGALRALLEASAPGGALHGAGLCGRLGDLGAVSGEYDVAVSSCSGTLDHIVVETAEGATACVEYLRKNSLGRASFVILEKLGHLEASLSQRFQAPSGCPRLFDLVQVSEERFRPAFYLALRDTLVAPHLEMAVATAYVNGRCMHRIVTAEGQLIDRSGAMTGGGNATKRGAMRISGGSGRSGAAKSAVGGGAAGGVGVVSAARAEELAADARKAEGAVRAARLEKKEAEGKVKKLEARGKHLQTLIPKLEMRLQGVGASEAQYEEQVEALQAQCQLTPEAEAELAKLTAALAKDEKMLAKVSKSLEKAEAAVQALQKAILEVGGEKLKKAVKRADGASAALDQAVESLSRSTVEGKGERKKGEKGAKDAERKRKELEAVRAQAEAEKEEFKGMEEKAFKVMGAFEAAEKDVAEKGAELKEISTAYEASKLLADKIKGVEVDITLQLQEYAKVINTNKANVKHWTAEFKKLRKAHAEEAEHWGLDEEEDGDGDGSDDDDEGQEEEKEAESKGGNGHGDDMSEEEAEEETLGEVGDGDGGKSKAKDGDDKAIGKEGPRASKRSNAKLGGPGVLPELDFEDLQDVNRDALKVEIAELEAEKKAKGSTVNLTALALYRKREAEYLERGRELEAATLARNEARCQYEELRRQRLEEFMKGFGQITLRLKEMYQMITLGGDAELELVDSLDPFSEGIVFSVRPPKKSWKNIANLSGGEKTLSSLALVFALHHFKPTPLYVMDEIDAALDFKNVSIVANYIKERTKNAQFIIISLRNNMFELADRLVGIYKTHNVTKSVTINPKQFAQQQQKQLEQRQNTLKRAPEDGSKPAGVLGDTTNAIRETDV